MSDLQNVPVTAVPSDARILDVREDYEWEAGHVDGAVHIPLDQLPARFGELDPDEDLHVICRAGGRSQRAAEWLEGNGYTAINVSGGMGAWADAGKPMVSETGSEPAVL
ncbi:MULTISPECIES: rhodanese-like domain-containing protein [unclassified Arthrobacter]|uniref:rhodanese-like domain-containing protein n=1 Tax=Arthrobacter sp. N1 TaxID=619291 RepID=UPI003BAE455A